MGIPSELVILAVEILLDMGVGMDVVVSVELKEPLYVGMSVELDPPSVEVVAEPTSKPNSVAVTTRSGMVVSNIVGSDNG